MLCHKTPHLGTLHVWKHPVLNFTAFGVSEATTLYGFFLLETATENEEGQTQI